MGVAGPFAAFATFARPTRGLPGSVFFIVKAEPTIMVASHPTDVPVPVRNCFERGWPWGDQQGRPNHRTSAVLEDASTIDALKSLPMFRIRRWLFVILLPAMFLGGCVSSIRPAWWLIERGWSRPVEEADRSIFPVLVRLPDLSFASASLGELPLDAVIVTDFFDEIAINEALNASIGSTGHYRFFQVLERDSDVTRVSLEVPTVKDSKLRGWYDIRGTEVVPRRIMLYGPGFAFVVFPVSVVCGLVVASLFAFCVRPQRSRS